MHRELYLFVYTAILKEFSMSPSNIALRKNTKQSSTWNDTTATADWWWKSFLATDGNRQQRSKTPGVTHFEGFCTHTNDQANEWWAVNLGALFYIYSIHVYGRNDFNNAIARLQDYTVDVIVPRWSSDLLSMDTMTSGVLNFRYYVSEPTEYLEIKCPDNIIGQFVRIQHRGSRFLTLCEVEVYGERTPCVTIGRFSKHVGFPGKRYQGTTIKTTAAVSEVYCMMMCREVPCCYAVNYNTQTRNCDLMAQVDPVTKPKFTTSALWNVFLLY